MLNSFHTEKHKLLHEENTGPASKMILFAHIIGCRDSRLSLSVVSNIFSLWLNLQVKTSGACALHHCYNHCIVRKKSRKGNNWKKPHERNKAEVSRTNQIPSIYLPKVICCFRPCHHGHDINHSREVLNCSFSIPQIYLHKEHFYSNCWKISRVHEKEWKVKSSLQKCCAI